MLDVVGEEVEIFLDGDDLGDLEGDDLDGGGFIPVATAIRGLTASGAGVLGFREVVRDDISTTWKDESSPESEESSSSAPPVLDR